MLSSLRSRLSTAANTAQVGPLVDNLDQLVQAVEAGDHQYGASFALTNAAQYALNAGSVTQIAVTIDIELVVIAHCFKVNRRRGL